MKRKFLVAALAALATIHAVVAPGWVLAQESEPGAEEETAAEPAWGASIGLSYLATSGNKHNRTVGLDVVATRRPMPWGLEFKAQVHREEEDSETTAKRYFVGLRSTRTLTERREGFASLSAITEAGSISRRRG